MERDKVAKEKKIPEPPVKDRVRFILASASPRRTLLLKQTGIEHEVLPACVDELSDVPSEDPGDHVTILAERKALAVAGSHPDALVLGADTVVYHKGEILGKPADFEDACRMVGRLSGDEHDVFTALALAGPGEIPVQSSFEVTRVRFRLLDPEHIKLYAGTGEPLDKAGAYGIQGYGATLVESVKGCYFNVMGLPLTRLIMMLAARGIDYPFGPLVVRND
ncbi:MAG: nucleoside triphosphate pyrophosphatase [Gemmatimonadota bacterium]|nr:nucleoside triphosphate pyrophosphatase [Gemmatimonadota bacterium]